MIYFFFYREYSSGLLSSYAVPPGVEAVHANDVRTDPIDEFETFQHSILLLLLSLSMFIGKKKLILYLNNIPNSHRFYRFFHKDFGLLSNITREQNL